MTQVCVGLLALQLFFFIIVSLQFLQQLLSELNMVDRHPDQHPDMNLKYGIHVILVSFKIVHHNVFIINIKFYLRNQTTKQCLLRNKMFYYNQNYLYLKMEEKKLLG